MNPRIVDLQPFPSTSVSSTSPDVCLDALYKLTLYSFTYLLTYLLTVVMQTGSHLMVCVNVARTELEPAQFISQLQDVTVEEGEKATFECYITGSPMPEVRWYVLFFAASCSAVDI